MRVDVWRGENLQEHGCLRDDFGMAVGGAHTPEGIQDLQRLAHRYNNFPKALEAVMRMHEREKINGLCGTTCDACRLIAELEEVE